MREADGRYPNYLPRKMQQNPFFGLLLDGFIRVGIWKSYGPIES